jgi:hypothetical protein
MIIRDVPIRSRAVSPVTKPRAKMVTLPVNNDATYPFQDAQYQVSFRNVIGTPTDFQGKISSITYGFTKATQKQFIAKKGDVKLVNSKGKPGSEWTQVSHRHNGSYKGLMVMDPVTVKVPAGRRLVMRVSYMRADGTGAQSNAYLVKP